MPLVCHVLTQCVDYIWQIKFVVKQLKDTKFTLYVKHSYGEYLTIHRPEKVEKAEQIVEIFGGRIGDLTAVINIHVNETLPVVGMWE